MTKKFSYSFLFLIPILFFTGMNNNMNNDASFVNDLQKEAMRQYERLEALRSGQLPMSRFAKPEFVFNQESLIFPADRDPADIVIRRIRALWNDLKDVKFIGRRN